MTQKRVAFLVMQEPGDFVTDYHLAIPNLQELGWDVVLVPWRSGPDWDSFDAVYLCTPWDYPQHAEEFFAVLETIEASTAVMFNPLSMVRWNIEKTYLRDVEARGDDIVPSIFPDNISASEVDSWFAQHGSDRIVIKPTIGGNAVDAFVLERPVGEEMVDTLARTFAGRGFVVQPFIRQIQTEGEYSLFFMNGEYSHATVKIPKSGDFRVQEEHGAELHTITPPDDLLEVGHNVFSHIEPLPVYGRGDWVRDDKGRWLLMELELIEPSLYLRCDSGAPARFARAFDQRFQEFTGK